MIELKDRIRIQDLQIELPAREKRVFNPLAVISEEEFEGVENLRDNLVHSVRMGHPVSWDLLINLALTNDDLIKPYAQHLKGNLAARFKKELVGWKAELGAFIHILSPETARQEGVFTLPSDINNLVDSYNLASMGSKVTEFLPYINLLGKPNILPSPTPRDWQEYEIETSLYVAGGEFLEYAKREAYMRLSRLPEKPERISEWRWNKILESFNEFRRDHATDSDYHIQLTHQLVHLTVLAADEITVDENGVHVIMPKTRKSFTDSTEMPSIKRF
jgi:hypothetical protein